MTNAAPQSGFFPCAARRVEALADRFATDEELIAGMLASDPAAWRDFQAKYDRLIMRCIAKVTGRFASMPSQDAVREVYANLYVSLLGNDMHKLRTFDPARGNRFSSWMGLLAINAAYDYLRTLKREPRKESISEALDLAADSPDPFELTSEHERASIARAALADFSEKDRTFAALYFGEGMDPEDIATTMNISVKTVYSKKHKIQTRLESVLATRMSSAQLAA